MQIQKDEIKNKIIEAALEEFLVSGYKNSSMRNIASQAGITVGNIYSYFSGKDDLFDNVLQDTVSAIKDLIRIEMPDDDHSISSAGIEQITRSITTVFLGNRIEFLILMNSSAGSKYENVKANLVDLVNQRLLQELPLRLRGRQTDPLLLDTIAVALIEGMLNIFNKYGGDQSRLTRAVAEFLTVIFKDIDRRI